MIKVSLLALFLFLFSSLTHLIYESYDILRIAIWKERQPGIIFVPMCLLCGLANPSWFITSAIFQEREEGGPHSSSIAAGAVGRAGGYPHNKVLC